MADDKKQLKILMTADTVGGVWTYCMELCRSLHQHGVQVHLATMGAPLRDWQKAEAAALPNVTVYETRFLLEWMEHPWKDLEESGEWLLRLEKKIQPDLVHLNCFAYGCLPFNAPKIMVAHSDVYSWFREVKGEDPPAQWSRYYRCVQKGLQGADRVIAPSQAMHHFLQSIYCIAGKGRVIYNGRRKELFYTAKNKERSVFSMGRLWDEAKNIRLLCDVASRINAPVYIAGDSSFGDNQVCPPRNVCFLGRLSSEEVAAQLAKAAIYVLPAKYEPFGLSALEAALSGCALVLGDIPSLREIWQETAVYVDTGNKEALAATLNDLLDDKNRLTAYQSKAVQHARQYSAKQMCRQYLTAYDQLLRQHKSSLTQELM